MSKKQVEFTKLSSVSFFAIVVLVATVTISGCAGKQVHSTLSDGASGKIYFETASPYEYKDIYDGIENDKKSIIYGELVIPENTQGKVPVVVFFHGSGGKSSKHLKWINRLQEMGIATFRVDSFSGRNISSLVGEQEKLPHPAMLVDAYMALKLLSTHPRIDRNKIGVMGGSKGGVVAVYTAYQPVRKHLVDDDLEFALHVGIYPFCHRLEKISMTGAPILILIGEKDDYTPADLCKNFSEAISQNGYDITLKVYPGAHHSFDSDHSLHFNKKAYNFENCNFLLLEEGVILETKSNMKMDTVGNRKKALSKCVKRGVHTEGNSKVTKTALDDMSVFVSKVFNLK